MVKTSTQYLSTVESFSFATLQILNKHQPVEISLIGQNIQDTSFLAHFCLNIQTGKPRFCVFQ